MLPASRGLRREQSNWVAPEKVFWSHPPIGGAGCNAAILQGHTALQDSTTPSSFGGVGLASWNRALSVNHVFTLPDLCVSPGAHYTFLLANNTPPRSDDDEESDDEALRRSGRHHLNQAEPCPSGGVGDRERNSSRVSPIHANKRGR